MRPARQRGFNRAGLAKYRLLTPTKIQSSGRCIFVGVQSNRLSRHFHKTLDQLRDIQAERRQRQQRDLKQAAAIFELHKRQGTRYGPAEDGFVFSIAEIESHSRRLMRHNEARHYEYVLFEGK